MPPLTPGPPIQPKPILHNETDKPTKQEGGITVYTYTQRLPSTQSTTLLPALAAADAGAAAEQAAAPAHEPRPPSLPSSHPPLPRSATATATDGALKLVRRLVVDVRSRIAPPKPPLGQGGAVEGVGHERAVGPVRTGGRAKGVPLLLVVLVLLGGPARRTQLQLGRARGRAREEGMDGGHAPRLLVRRLLAVVVARRRQQRGDFCATLSACGYF